MDIDYYKNKKNQFILDGKKIKVPNKVSLEFYNLINLGEYEEALNLLNSKGYKKIFPFIITGSASLVLLVINILFLNGLIDLNIGYEIFMGLYYGAPVGFFGSLAGFTNNYIKNIKLDNIKYKIEDEIERIENFNNQEKENEEIYEETYEETIDKININDNSFVFDSNRERNSNIIDLEEYRKKLR